MATQAASPARPLIWHFEEYLRPKPGMAKFTGAAQKIVAFYGGLFKLPTAPRIYAGCKYRRTLHHGRAEKKTCPMPFLEKVPMLFVISSLMDS